MVTLSNHGKSYFAETSLHGLKYITEDGRHPVERVLWVVLFFVGVSLMITFMIPGIQKYMDNPTSTSLDTRDHPIWNIDFPGITVCPNTKIMKSNFRAAMKAKSLPWLNISKKFEDDSSSNMSGSDFQYSLLTVLTNMAQFNIDPKSVEQIEDKVLEKLLNEMRQEVATLMRTVAPNCKRLALVCRWHGEFRNCSEMFKVTKTDDGFCCSFNTVSLSEGFAKSPDLQADSDDSASYDYEDEAGMDYYYDYGDYGDTGTGIGDNGTEANDTSDGTPEGNEIQPPTCTSLTGSIKKAGIARWFTGCYINEEDACFESKATGSFSDLDYADTEKEITKRAFPVKADFKAKKQLRTNGASKLLGLSVLLDPMLHDKIDSGSDWEDSQRIKGADSNFYEGWKVHIHNPSEFPEVGKKGVLVGIGQEVSISLSAEHTSSSDSVKSMSPTRRKCLLQSETDVPEMYSMKMFLKYKKSSCLLECRAEQLMKQFGCLPYFYPELPVFFIKQFSAAHKKADSISCSSAQLKVMAAHIAKLSAMATGTEDKRFISGLRCENCPDECESTQYSFQTSSANFVDTGNFFYKALLRKGETKAPAINELLFKEYELYVKDIFSETEGNVEVSGPPRATKDPRPYKKSCLETTVHRKIGKMSYLHVYFKTLGITKYQKNVAYGWQDLIAFFGGIVGLCVGFSLLSGAELIYFFTVRLYFDYRNEKNKVEKEETCEKMGKELQKEFFDQIFDVGLKNETDGFDE